MNRRIQKNPKCQRCLEEGHWSYECTNPPAYVYRPSARAIYFNPELKKKIETSPDPSSPSESPTEKSPEHKNRSRSRSSSSSHSSSSSSN